MEVRRRDQERMDFVKAVIDKKGRVEIGRRKLLLGCLRVVVVTYLVVAVIGCGAGGTRIEKEVYFLGKAGEFVRETQFTMADWHFRMEDPDEIPFYTMAVQEGDQGNELQPFFPPAIAQFRNRVDPHSLDPTKRDRSAWLMVFGKKHCGLLIRYLQDFPN